MVNYTPVQITRAGVTPKSRRRVMLTTMYEEPEQSPSEQASNPAQRAAERADELRMHAELAAVFEGCRKFDAQIDPRLDPEIARDIQRTIGKLEKARSTEHPILPPDVASEAQRLLDLPATAKLPTNDYHIHRRPGEVMIVRFLQGLEVETFYDRLQAHFDAALNQFREEERQSLAWKQEKQTLAYLEALDKLEYKMVDRYLREVIRKHHVFVLSTQTADEIDIMHLATYLMGVEPAEIVGRASAPGDDPAEGERAWFFKLFSLRGATKETERMCCFGYLQKSEETF